MHVFIFKGLFQGSVPKFCLLLYKRWNLGDLIKAFKVVSLREGEWIVHLFIFKGLPQGIAYLVE